MEQKNDTPDIRKQEIFNSSETPPDVDYKLIKQWLPWGEILAIARQNRLSKSSAYKILTGRQKNFDFLAQCYEKAIEQRARFKRYQQRLQQP